MKMPRRLVLCATGVALATCGCGTFRHADDTWWGPDKARHLTLSMALAAGTSYALADGGTEGEAAAVAGLGVAALAGAAKEVHDQRIKRTYFSGKDLVWDLIGGLAGGLLGAAAADE